MNKLSSLKAALVYDKATTKFGGAEHVLQALHKIFPDAPLYTSVQNQNADSWADAINIKPSFLQRLPYLRNHPQMLAPLMPLAFESHNLESFDLVISVTSGEAKGVLTKPGQLHICYLLTPPRYVYSHRESYLNSAVLTRLPVFRQLAHWLLDYLKWWDQAAAYRPDYIIPISELVKTRIKNFYDIESENVIYPPAVTLPAKHQPELPFENFLLTASRLVSYKRIDLAVGSALYLHKKLVVAGTGPELKNLLKRTGGRGAVRKKGVKLADFFKNNLSKSVFFTGTVTNEEMAHLISSSKAILMPGIEDFGITALQANLAGKPAVLHHKSGAAELIKDGIHGVHLQNDTEAELIAALKRLDEIEFNADKISAFAAQYGTQSFTTQFTKKVYDLFISYSRKLP